MKVFSWQTAGRVGTGGGSGGTGGNGPGTGTATSQFGTSHLDALVDEATAAYVAPEALSNPNADLDVFSLGAVAFLVLTGTAPATSSVELLRAVRAGNGLQLPAVLDGVDEGFRTLIAQATCPAALPHERRGRTRHRAVPSRRRAAQGTAIRCR